MSQVRCHVSHVMFKMLITFCLVRAQFFSLFRTFWRPGASSFHFKLLGAVVAWPEINLLLIMFEFGIFSGTFESSKVFIER